MIWRRASKNKKVQALKYKDNCTRTRTMNEGYRETLTRKSFLIITTDLIFTKLEILSRNYGLIWWLSITDGRIHWPEQGDHSFWPIINWIWHLVKQILTDANSSCKPHVLLTTTKVWRNIFQRYQGETNDKLPRMNRVGRVGG